MAAGAGDVSLDGLFDSAVGIVKHDGSVTGVEFGLKEQPGDVLEDDGGGGGGVIDEGNFVDVIGVDKGLDELPGSKN